MTQQLAPQPAPQLSQQQETFLSALAGRGSALLDARAGSGKTFTLTQAAQRVAPGLALAFNKRNAEDLQRKFPEVWHCKTMNGLGHQAWTRFLGSRRPNLQTRKLWELIKLPQFSAIPYKSRFDIVKLTEMCKALGYVPSGVPSPVTSWPVAWDAILDSTFLDDSDGYQEWTEALLRESITSAFQGLIDFSDQVYMSVIWGAPFSRYLTIVVDEAQDLSMLQHQMTLRSVHQDGRALIAGDAFQAIYAWRGAEPTSLYDLQAHFSAEIFPLTLSFRCPKAVVAEAQNWVKDIEAPACAPDGRVIGNFSQPIRELSREEIQAGLTILCRNNAPLVRTLFRLLKQGIVSTILGRDFLAGIKSYIQKHARADIPSTIAALREDTRHAVSLARTNEDETKTERLLDRMEAIVAMAENIGKASMTVPDFLDAIDRLFTDTPAGQRVLLSTIHKAKGMEWPRVAILAPNLFRLKRPQEENLVYVAITRAQNTLTWLAEDARLGDAKS